MTIIERAARALARAQSGADEWEGLDDELQSQLKAEALAVIEAIRKPTPEIARAGEKLLADDRMHSVSQNDMRDSWIVMVDAILNKGVSG